MGTYLGVPQLRVPRVLEDRSSFDAGRRGRELTRPFTDTYDAPMETKAALERPAALANYKGVMAYILPETTPEAGVASKTVLSILEEGVPEVRYALDNFRDPPDPMAGRYSEHIYLGRVYPLTAGGRACGADSPISVGAPYSSLTRRAEFNSPEVGSTNEVLRYVYFNT